MKKSATRLISLFVLVSMVGIGVYWIRASEPKDTLLGVQDKAQHKPNSETNLAAVKSASSDIVIDNRQMIDGIKQRRKLAWRDAENAQHLEESILSLLRDPDVESARFALYLKLTCTHVTSKSEKNPEFGISFLDFQFGSDSGQS